MASPLHAAEHDCCPRCTLLARNARTLADAMALRDWTITVAHDPPGDAESVMLVELAAEQKRLRLRAAPDFWAMTDREKRRHLAHELVHAHLRDLWETTRQAIAHEVGGASGRVLTRQIAIEKERVVDVLATVLAPHLPELEW